MNPLKKHRPAAVVLALTCFGQAREAVGCGSGYVRHGKPQTIALRGVATTPAFYLRGGGDFVMIFQAENVVGALEKRIQTLRAQSLTTAASATEEFLVAVRNDLPLKGQT